eukprot:c3492_g1_i1.p1 GENE.c3492_g1_i1~~c3492_g1_i1.p1  ORF type:complete len:538 (+),score=160.64 c3492_g1_i1:95-1708(+)
MYLNPNSAAKRATGGIKNRKKSQQFFAQEASTALESAARLDIMSNPSRHRKTSIICTLGPKTSTVEKVTALREAGMNIVRLNFSHGSYEFHGGVIANVRESVEKHPLSLTKKILAIALDTKGPEIRTGMTKDGGDVVLEADSEVTVTVDRAFENSCDANLVFVDYPNIVKVVSVGSLVFIDDGLISLRVEAINEKSLTTRVINTGALGSKKGVNLPGVRVDLPALSEKDRKDLRFAVEQGVDMIFASFIRKAEDVHEVRECLGSDGAHIKIVSKIENQEGVQNFDQILAVTDGIMVARGDLGIEIPYEKVFVAQKMMISKCNLAGKPVICATQMLESMIQNPRPTRAEVSDVANAVLDGADCVMLSGETAKGAYPVEAVSMMAQICTEAESAVHYKMLKNTLMRSVPGSLDNSEPVAMSVVIAASSHDCKCIVTLTHSGESARLISKFRPKCPIIVVSREAHILRQVHLHRGCFPVYYPEPRHESRDVDMDNRHQFGMQAALDEGFVNPGDTVIVTYGWLFGEGNRSLTDFRITKVQ